MFCFNNIYISATTKIQPTSCVTIDYFKYFYSKPNIHFLIVVLILYVFCDFLRRAV